MRKQARFNRICYRGLVIDRPNQVWAMDIIYIRMARGFVDLAAGVDWFSRWVLAWWLSITMEVDFCLKRLRRHLPNTAGRRFSTPTKAAKLGHLQITSSRSDCLPTRL